MKTLKEFGIDVIKRGTKASLIAIGGAFIMAIVEDKAKSYLGIVSPSEEHMKGREDNA